MNNESINTAEMDVEKIINALIQHENITQHGPGYQAAIYEALHNAVIEYGRYGNNPKPSSIVQINPGHHNESILTKGDRPWFNLGLDKILFSWRRKRNFYAHRFSFTDSCIFDPKKLKNRSNYGDQLKLFGVTENLINANKSAAMLSWVPDFTGEGDNITPTEKIALNLFINNEDGAEKFNIHPIYTIDNPNEQLKVLPGDQYISTFTIHPITNDVCIEVFREHDDGSYTYAGTSGWHPSSIDRMRREISVWHGGDEKYPEGENEPETIYIDRIHAATVELDDRNN